MSFLKWRKTLDGTRKADLPVDEQAIRARLREFVIYVEMGDYDALLGLVDAREDAYYSNLEEFAAWNTLPREIALEVEQAYENGYEAYADDNEYTVQLPRLVWWYLEELLAVYESVDWDPEEEWVEYDDPADIEDYGEGYWHTPDVDDPFIPQSFRYYRDRWEEFFESLPEELKDEFQ